MVFSTNQNRQLYVVTGSLTEGIANLGANVGNVASITDVDGNKAVAYRGVKGIQRTDLVDPKSITWGNLTEADATNIKLKAYTVTLKEDPRSGQDYILRINFRQLYGMSDEDIYQKYGAVHAVSGMTKQQFYSKMIQSLIKNFSRVYAPLLLIKVGEATIVKAVTLNADATIDIDGTDVEFAAGDIVLYDEEGNAVAAPGAEGSEDEGFIIAEKSQVDQWVLGTAQYTPVYFEVIPTTITDAGGNEVVWGTVSPVAAEDLDTVPNGYTYADLEYFCMGERGDQYRNLYWPNSIKTTYLVDPTQEYVCLDIHYAYQGTCEDIQKSEKTMTFLAKKSEKAVLTSIGQFFGVIS